MGSVVVAGGGLAGLVCAWRLQRAGHDVEVLELAPEPGGSRRNRVRGDFVLDGGESFDLDHSPNLVALAAALGVAERLRPLPRSRQAVLRDCALHPLDLTQPGSLLRTRLLSARGAAGLVRVAAAALRAGGRAGADPDVALDGRDARSWLVGLAGEEACDYVLAPLLARRFAAPPESLSAALALPALRQALRRPRLGCFAHGNGLLVRSLAAGLAVRAGCQVLAVESETGGARVRYRSGDRECRVVADAAVVALPGPQVAALCPKLTPQERGFFAALRPEPGAVLELLLDEPPRLGSYLRVSVPSPEGLAIRELVADHWRPGAARAGTGLLRVQLGAGAAARLRAAGSGEWAGFVARELARTPLGAPRAQDCVRQRADLGAQRAPGHVARALRFRRRVERSPRLAFAGSYLAGADAVGAEAAVASGMRAATAIAREL